MFQATTRGRGALVIRNISDRRSCGNYGKPSIESSKLPQERLQARFTQPSFLWTRWILKRLQTVQNKQGSAMRDEFRESLSLLPPRAYPWIRISKPFESSVKKFISRRSLPTAALSVKGPAKNELCRTILFSSHPSEPMVDERRLPDPGPGNDGNHVDVFARPSIIEESDILLSTKNIASCNGQSGYGNLLRCKSCWRLASSDTRSDRGHLLQALTSDSTPRVDSICYGRYRLQKFRRVLKSPRRVFLKESFK